VKEGGEDFFSIGGNLSIDLKIRTLAGLCKPRSPQKARQSLLPSLGQEETTPLKFTLNGQPQIYLGDLEQSLLDMLRLELGLRSVKSGCAPQGSCGACTVQVNGKPTLSCVTPMRKVEGKDVSTIEGLDPSHQKIWADAFVEAGGIQCGFCTPGIVMTAEALVRKNPTPKPEQIEKALTRHLCRCTGYKKVVDSIQEGARRLQADPPTKCSKTKCSKTPAPPTGKLGTRLPKVGARELVLGQRPFVADLLAEGMLHAALHFSQYPRAKILSMDLTAALACDGVRRILTVENIPGTRHTGLVVQDWPLMMGPGDTTRYVGDVLACVVAETRAQARAAAACIQVEYRVLEPVLSPREALAEGAPEIHKGGNLLARSLARVGDFARAWKECAFRTEGIWNTQRVEHAYLEPECALALPSPGGGIKVYSQSQGVYEDQKSLCSLLDLSPEQVEIELVPNGGGFGGKEDLSVQGHAALAALLLQSPVRLEFTRAESMRFHPKRHPIEMEVQLGCTAEGKLHAVRFRNVGDTGAYASVGMKVLERSAGHATGAYHCPNVDVEALAVYTNQVPSGAFRGFGANQVVFALEGAMDQLCELGGFDPWQFRWDNALVEGLSTATGQILEGGVGTRPTLEALRPYYREAQADPERVVGLACGLKNTGMGNGYPDEGRVKIRILGPEEIEIHHGWTEMGQGVDTVAVQFLCQETGFNPAWVKVLVNTGEAVPTGMTTASRATSLLGKAILNACTSLRKDLAEFGLKTLVGREYRGRWVCDWTTASGDPKVEKIVTHYSYSYAAQMVELDQTGRILRVVAAHDAGKIVNRTLFEGQIEGAVHMGLGYALSEEIPTPGGYPSERLGDCQILSARATPEIVVLGVEVPDPVGPHGAKGVGEIGLVPTAGAVANAFARLIGKRPFQLPLRRGERTTSA
jgi:selenium-dependent xanthine dehydrogenase